MKRFILVLTISFLAFSETLATEQFSDALIIGNDTVYLQSFPLEDLGICNKLKAPFNYGEYSFPHTACYREYIVTWQVIDETLVHKEIVKIDSLGTRFRANASKLWANFNSFIMWLLSFSILE